MLWEEVLQKCLTPIAEQNSTLQVATVNLHHRLATPATWPAQDTAPTNGDNCHDMSLAMLEHLGDGGHLCTEAQTTGQVDAYTCVNVPRSGTKRSRDCAGGELIAEIESAENSLRGLN